MSIGSFFSFRKSYVNCWKSLVLVISSLCAVNTVHAEEYGEFKRATGVNANAQDMYVVNALNHIMSEFRRVLMTGTNGSRVHDQIGEDRCYARARLLGDFLERIQSGLEVVGYLRISFPPGAEWRYHVATVIRYRGSILIADSLDGFSTMEDWARANNGDVNASSYQFVSRQFEAGCSLDEQAANSLQDVRAAIGYHNPSSGMEVASLSRPLNDLHNVARMRNSLRQGQGIPDADCSYIENEAYLRSQLSRIANDILQLWDNLFVNQPSPFAASGASCSSWGAHSSSS